MFNAVKEINKIIEDYQNRDVKYGICDICNKQDSCNGEICLPVEMLSQLLDEQDQDKRLEMLDNVEYLFIDRME